jgi:hypothetical protein
VLLRSGNVSAHKDVRYGTAQPAIEVVANGANAPVLAAGGPLTNSVGVQRQGRSLSLNYQLLGADGAPYQLMSQNRTDPPRFVVYKKGKQIHSGRFEFG